MSFHKYQKVPSSLLTSKRNPKCLLHRKNRLKMKSFWLIKPSRKNNHPQNSLTMR
ncbi:hypothetical protein HMPREF3039_01308 [Akkermansia sp. KLE1798]|nr:hypothetical protein HMPREF3039_01308 [Akkermansia sp. KLE1798]